MVYQKSTPFTESKTRVDFWKKFHDEWEELNRHTETKKRLVTKCKRQKPSKLEKPSKTWAGGQWPSRPKPSKLEKPSKTWAGGQWPSRPKPASVCSTDKTHDVSQRPCRLVWMPSLLAIPFLPKSQHV